MQPKYSPKVDNSCVRFFVIAVAHWTTWVLWCAVIQIDLSAVLETLQVRKSKSSCLFLESRRKSIHLPGNFSPYTLASLFSSRFLQAVRKVWDKHFVTILVKRADTRGRQNMYYGGTMHPVQCSRNWKESLLDKAVPSISTVQTSNWANEACQSWREKVDMMGKII